MKLVTVAEMREIEREANAQGISYEAMMEHAGEGLGAVVESAYSQSGDRKILGLVGSGNNGGDTLVALNYLANAGWQTTAYLVRPREENDPLIARYKKSGGQAVAAGQDSDGSMLEKSVLDAAVVLDGVLGTGSRLPLRPEIASPLEKVKNTIQKAAQKPHVVAVDCPSGIDCDTGDSAPEVLRAELTVTMAAVKQGMLAFPAFEHVGSISVVGIGLPDDFEPLQKIHREVADETMIRDLLPVRSDNSHKGTYGTALIVGGSTNFTGSVLLASEGAYRIGAGLVTMAVPASLHVALAGSLPEATWLLLPQEMGVIAADAASMVKKSFEKATALLLGPGWGMENTTQTFLSRLLSERPKTNKPGIGFVRSDVQPKAEPENVKFPPAVIDADGLKLLSRIQGWPNLLPDRSVLTPHPGEMAILTGLSTTEIQTNRIEVAEKYAREWRKVVVLKGACTVVADPDGCSVVIPVATSALAKAGTGDVLSGMITGLCAQKIDPFSAAVAGAWIHAQAGLAAQRQWGTGASVLAGDVALAIAAVLEQLER